MIQVLNRDNNTGRLDGFQLLRMSSIQFWRCNITQDRHYGYQEVLAKDYDLGVIKIITLKYEIR